MAPNADPARTARLQELLGQITTMTNDCIELRSQLEALPPASSDERTTIEQSLDNKRLDLIGVLDQRVTLLDAEIASLNARVGPAPTSSPDDPAGDELGLQLNSREQERRQHQQQLRPLRRWRTRHEIAEIDAHIADIDAQLATMPQVSDPNDPTAELLALQRIELQAQRRELARSLTSTATEFEQFDPRWGSKRYGPSAQCTNIAAAGCGPTSLAIVMNYLYQEDPESLASSGAIEIVTPTETAPYAATHGRVCNNGTVGDTMVTNVQTQWPGYRGRRITLDDATSQLQSGNLVIFLCHDCTGQTSSGGPSHYGGHFMVLNGVEATGNFQVLDPGRGESSDIQTITRAELASHTAGFWIVEPK